MNKQELIAELTSTKKYAEGRIAKFQEKLADDPAYAFSWADGAMSAAAEAKVCEFVLAVLENEEVTVEHVRKEATAMTMRAARYPASSSSEVSNAMERKIGAAWAKLLDRLN